MVDCLGTFDALTSLDGRELAAVSAGLWCPPSQRVRVSRKVGANANANAGQQAACKAMHGLALERACAPDLDRRNGAAFGLLPASSSTAASVSALPFS